MEFKWNEDEEVPLLFLDGTDHDSLPYLSPDFRLEDNELPQYKMSLTLNKTSISKEYHDPTEWESHVFQHKITQELLGAVVDDIKLQKFSQKTVVTTELLDLLSNLRMPQTGLKMLEVSEPNGGMEEPMEQAVIE